MRLLTPNRRPILLGACLLIFALRWPAAAQEIPRPPCEGMAPFPAYAAVEAPPQVGVWSPEPLDDPGLAHVRLWSGEEVGAWPPPPCTDWTSLPFTVALAARFRHAGGVEGLLRRLGAVSELARAPYWAAARRRWEPLFDAAYAVSGPEMPERRGDFRPEEMQAGRDLYSHQDPGGPVGGAVYRMRLREVGSDRLVVEVENVTTARVAALFPLGPGTLRFVHFFARTGEAQDAWGYYGLMGIAITPDSARTYVNRMAGIFRHLAGIPGEQAPPVWP
jgi:hypothetical protein